MWEFDVFPTVIISMVALGVLIGLLGFFGKISYKWFIGWFIVMSILGILGMYDFNAWLIDYWHQFRPKRHYEIRKPPMVRLCPINRHCSGIRKC